MLTSALPTALRAPTDPAPFFPVSADKLSRVAVFDPGYPSTLALVRSLARAGVNVMAYNHGRHWPLRLSRYVDQIRACPNVRDHERFPAWLDQQLENGVFDMVAPTSDVICYHLAGVVDRMPDTVRARLPTRDALLDVLFKDRLALACGRHGIATPTTRAPISLEQALADAQVVGYPLLLKPRTHIASLGDRGRRIDSAAQLRAAFKAYELPASEHALLAAHPQLAWPLLQQYVDHRAQQLSCSGLLDDAGRLLAGAATVKVDQSPSLTGVGTAFASYHGRGFVEACGRSVQALLGRGLFEIELLQSAAETPPLVIDVNARVFGQIDFDIARGNDLPALWHASLTADIKPRPQPTRAMVCLYPAPFLVSNLTRTVTGPRRRRRLTHALGLLRRARSFIGWSWRDPIASLLSLSRPLRHPTTFIKSHIREPYDGGSP